MERAQGCAPGVLACGLVTSNMAIHTPRLNIQLQVTRSSKLTAPSSPSTWLRERVHPNAPGPLHINPFRSRGTRLCSAGKTEGQLL